MVYDDAITQDWEMFQVTKKVMTAMESADVEAVRSKRGDTTIIVYQTKAEKAEGKGLLNVKDFKEVYALEKEILDHKNYTLLCMAKSPYEPECSDSAFISPVQSTVAFVEKSTGKTIEKMTEAEFEDAF